MTSRSVRRKLWRPDWTWRLRQMSCLLFVVWFVGAGVLAGVSALVDRRLVGWVVGVWFLGLLVFIAVMNTLVATQRRRWAAVAGQLGWKVTATEPSLAERWPFRPFDADDDPEVTQVTTGTYRDRRFWSGTFSYTFGRQRLGFAFLDLEIDRPLPPVHVAPESMGVLVAPGLQPMDLHLENREFNERYRLAAGDPATAHALLSPRVMEVLLSVQPFGFVTHGDRFVVVGPGLRQPKTMLAQMDAACDVLDLVPEHLWQAGERWVAERRT